MARREVLVRSTTQVSRKLTDLTYRVRYAGDVVVLTLRGKAVAALVPLDVLSHGLDEDTSARVPWPEEETDV